MTDAPWPLGGSYVLGRADTAPQAAPDLVRSNGSAMLDQLLSGEPVDRLCGATT